MGNKFNIRGKIKNLERLKNTLPQILANQARLFFVRSWEIQGFEDSSVNKWAPRAKETKKTKGKNILVSTGALRRATRNSIRDVSFNFIRLVVDLPYAARHNEGLDGMPERKFMGKSRTLGKQHLNTIIKYLSQI